MSPPRITVYTRAGCKLCAEAERVVAEVATGRAVVELIDIDVHPELTDRYTVRVPVIAVDGEELFEFAVDPAALSAALSAPSRESH